MAHVRLRSICGALFALAVAGPASARITSITFTVQSPTFGGTSFGAVGQYEKLTGRVTGEVDPDDPLNRVIVDIQLGQRNARGMVEYATDFLLLRPIASANGNRRLVYDITNRGNTNVLGIFNDANSGGNNPTTAADAGNGFLMRNGFIVLMSGWDFSAPDGTFTATVAPAFNRNGSHIPGLNSEELVVDTGGTPTTLGLTYPASTLDKSKATLTVRRLYTDPPVLIPSTGWEFIDSTTVGLLPRGTRFKATNLYEFTYPAQDPVVAGLGFAAIRDIVAFLRNGGADNPLAGLVDKVYSVCSSQPCRTMRDFVALGFNQIENARDRRGRGDDDDGDDDGDHHRGSLAFDGVLNWKGGGSGIFLNTRFSQPVRTHRQHIARSTPEIQFPFANEKIHDPVTGQTAGRLDRCKASHTCPKIFEANSANEFWAKAASNLLTDARGRDIRDLDRNVRYYLQSSAPHGAANGNGICLMPRNPLGPNQLLRGLLVALDEWVSFGERPPENRIPRVSDGTLVPALPQSGEGFPDIPGVTYNGIRHTGDLFDFGPRFLSQGIMDVLPPILLGTPYPSLVPKTDADGNDIAGVRMPEVAVPTATLTGWNLRTDAGPDGKGAHDGCDASGLRVPFPATAADRIRTGDPRPSIQERYPTHQAYVGAVTKAVQGLLDERFIVQEDADAYIAAAQASTIGN